jgi:hypothetical protein
MINYCSVGQDARVVYGLEQNRFASARLNVLQVRCACAVLFVCCWMLQLLLLLLL